MNKDKLVGYYNDKPVYQSENEEEYGTFDEHIVASPRKIWLSLINEKEFTMACHYNI